MFREGQHEFNDKVAQDPVSLMFFFSIAIQIWWKYSFHSHLDSYAVIATKFCTWHDSYAVVACAKNCCDLMASNGITRRQSFHWIWIAGKKVLVKRAPVQVMPWCQPGIKPKPMMTQITDASLDVNQLNWYWFRSQNMSVVYSELTEVSHSGWVLNSSGLNSGFYPPTT